MPRTLHFPLFIFISVLFLTVAGSLIARAEAPVIVSAEELGGETRYLSFISTDKPIYRPSEDLYLRVVMLNSRDYTPIPDRNISANIEIKGPLGNIVHQDLALGSDSTIGYQWTIPADLSGGNYTAIVRSAEFGVVEAERRFQVRRFRAPRINGEVAFVRDAYGVGDRVRVSAILTRAEGGVPVDARVVASARVDGLEIFRSGDLAVRSDGYVKAEFDLPESMDVGDGSVTFVIEDGGTSESVSKTLPIVLNKLNVDFYPESGELIAGLGSRVYVQVRRTNGKPADVEGDVVSIDENSGLRRVVAKLKTTHEGRAVFLLEPEPNTQYELLITNPLGDFPPYQLPNIKKHGVVLSAVKPVYGNEDPITVKLTSSLPGIVDHITLYKREKLIDRIDDLHDVVSLDPSMNDGVMIVTAWNANGLPLAERLVYRKPTYRLNIELNLSSATTTPGSENRIDIATTDENGKPVEAIVGLTVTDESVLNMIDSRDRAPDLPVMVYLEPEVLELADADIYLDETDNDAEATLDMLLGTQGWRRFILIEYSEIKSIQKLAASQAMAQVQLPKPVAMPRVAQDENAGIIALLNFFKAEDVEDRVVAVQAVADAAAPIDAAVPEIEAELDAIAADEWIAAEQKIRAPAEALPIAVFREYAHPVRENGKSSERHDFTNTVFWHAGIRTDAREGRASVSFAVSDSVTSFRVNADGFSRNGAIGSANTIIRSVEPFYVEPKLPAEVTAGDVLEIPVVVVNASDDTLKKISLTLEDDQQTLVEWQWVGATIQLQPGERRRQTLRLRAMKAGEITFSISANAGVFEDQVTRTLKINPSGFPMTVNESGVLSNTRGYVTEVELPQDFIAESLVTVAKLYPSPLANMQDALKALLQQPHGCFEQTSSTNYPLVMAQQYFQSHDGIDPSMMSEAQDLLKIGYDKLISFETSSSGYEWFGQAPAHEALTAYGLMEFVDMAKVMSVDRSMIDRTREWLLGRRDGKGGFRRDTKALDSFGAAPELTTNAYIVWALLESGEKPRSLSEEIEVIKQASIEGGDSYVLALMANILFLYGDEVGADAMRTRLASLIDSDGAVGGASTSITRSGGKSLMIETTSLAVLAWLNGGQRWTASIETAMQWLFAQSQAGRFGSTQSTILALRAINAYDLARSASIKPGSVQLIVNDRKVGRPVRFDANSKGAMLLPDFTEFLSAGSNRLRLEMDDGVEMPFAIEVAYHVTEPASSDIAPLTLHTQLTDHEVREGEPVEMKIRVIVGAEQVASPVVIVGIPAGLELRYEWLQELVGEGRISAFEMTGREVVLYWRQLPADFQLTIPLQLTASIPGSYTAPASRIYPYYTDELKTWFAGSTVEITPSGQ